MTPYQFGVKLAIKMAAAPQAMNMNNNGAPQAGDMGDHLNEQINLVHKLVAQGRAEYPYDPNPPFNPVQAVGRRSNPAASRSAPIGVKRTDGGNVSAPLLPGGQPAGPGTFTPASGPREPVSAGNLPSFLPKPKLRPHGG